MRIGQKLKFSKEISYVSHPDDNFEELIPLTFLLTETMFKLDNLHKSYHC
jgi:hypothetical protein